MVNSFMVFLGAALAFSVVVRCYIYIYIGRKHNRQMGSAIAFPLEALWYYTDPVEEGFEKLKKRCNILQTVHIIVLGILVVYHTFIK